MRFKTIKSILLFFLALGVTVSATGQKIKVVTAYNYNKAYERDKDCSDLLNGVEAIEEAVKDNRTQEWAKTWYYGGNLYFNAAFNDDPQCVSQFEEPLDKSFEYYLNALKYNIKDEDAENIDFETQEGQMRFMGFLQNKSTKWEDFNYTRDILGNKFPFIANAYLTLGYDAYENSEFKNAKEYYEKTISVNGIIGRLDTGAFYNAAITSERLEEYDDALVYYQILTQLNYGGADIYQYMASVYERKGDTINKMKTIEAGLKKYPEHEGLIREELSTLLAQGKVDDALDKFDKAIEKDPNDPVLYYNKGIIYDQLGNTEMAAELYNKTLEVDPEFFDAAYNLGAMYFNSGAEENNKAAGYDLNEQKKYDEAVKRANEYFKLAEPALMKAHEINPKDKSTLSSLVKLYSLLGEDGKYQEMKTKLDNL